MGEDQKVCLFLLYSSILGNAFYALFLIYFLHFAGMKPQGVKMCIRFGPVISLKYCINIINKNKNEKNNI